MIGLTKADTGNLDYSSEDSGDFLGAARVKTSTAQLLGGLH